MTYARRASAILAGIAFTAFMFGTPPLASPAAQSKSTSAKKALAAKALAKKPVKAAGYHPRGGPAPADEYFGRLQMSILGVRNKVKDLGLSADVYPERGAAVLGNAMWVEDAMRDWAKKYPFDRWLPRYAYALEQMYEHIPGDAAHRRAVKQVAYLTAYFPQTHYGKVGRAKLAQGIPTPDPSDRADVQSELERLALLDGKVLPTMPPAPSPKPSPTPAPVVAPEPAGEAGTARSASPSPASPSPLR